MSAFAHSVECAYNDMHWLSIWCVMSAYDDMHWLSTLPELQYKKNPFGDKKIKLCCDLCMIVIMF